MPSDFDDLDTLADIDNGGNSSLHDFVFDLIDPTTEKNVIIDIDNGACEE